MPRACSRNVALSLRDRTAKSAGWVELARPTKLIASVLLVVCLLATGTPLFGQAALTPDEQAALLLASARKAYNEQTYPFAVEKFREFVQKFGGHKDANAARFGLALALLEAPDQNFDLAVEPLQHLAEVGDFPDRPLALYYLGLTLRGQGHTALALAVAKPAEATQHQTTAKQKFELAATRFGESVPALLARVKPAVAGAPPADPKTLPVDVEWVARARCDHAESLLQVAKFKEARDAVTPFEADPVLIRSRYRGLGLYLHGHASFGLKEYPAAGKILSQLAPFNDPVFGVHARYLLARTHHLSEERPEAATLYEAVLTSFDQQRKDAQKTLGDANLMKQQPHEKLRLESLLKQPPEFVPRTTLYLGVLLFEQQRFAESQARLNAFIQLYPTSPLLPEVQLRLGFTQVQLRQYPDAVKTLTALQDHPQLSDQARRWLARAVMGAADVNNAAAVTQSQQAALEHLRIAAERAAALAATDLDAKTRRGDILLERADTQQLIKQFAESIVTYDTVLKENLIPDRADEATQRRCTALHLAGKHAESDAACQQFLQQFAKSPLAPAVLFRFAENAYLVAVAASNNAQLPNRDAELKKLFGEAIKRYDDLLKKHPEFQYVSLARFGQAMSHYKLGEFEPAQTILEKIPDGDRAGDLVGVPYLLADSILRTMSTDSNDALAAGRMSQQLDTVIKLLDSFVASLPDANKHPLTPDGLIKLGHAHQLAASLVVIPEERAKSLTAARQAYERLTQNFAAHALFPVATFERAKCLASANDIGGAINELNRFAAAPLNAAPVAPLALLRLASLHRSQNKPIEAEKILAVARQQEGPMLADPARVAWVPLIQYHHALSMKEQNKLPEARALFESITKQFAARPEAAEAAWRAGQCRKDEIFAKQVPIRAVLVKPDAKPEELTAARTAFDQTFVQLRETGQYFLDQAGLVGTKSPGSDAHLRLLYEAAWCQRLVGDAEIDATRAKLLADAIKKLQEDQAKKTPPVPGVASLPVRPPEIALATIPIQPAEQKARDHYKAVIAAGPDAQLANDARLELAELHASRAEHDPAIALVTQALDKEPSPELTERLQMRFGACLVAKGDPTGAVARFDSVAANEKSPLAPEARYRAGECLLLKQDYAGAIKTLQPFRDHAPLQNIKEVSDRALLRLGHAFGHAAQWDASRQTLEVLVGRFGTSPWVDEARYGIGWAWQNQNQFDNAVNSYLQVIQRTAAEIAAKAQLQIGLCRLQQKRHAEAASALLVVPFTYDYPEWSALALCEASRVFVELKQPDQAGKLLQRVMKDHPTSKWADVAKQRLGELK
ncbi:MAG: tetratricopeptide repeat protein [Planctomycetales bacterium]|nr:tetratricopeptide repeat protein [Planctomycetales bacterium]